MKAAITADKAAALIPDGARLLIGGFMGVGSPHRLIDALVKRGAKNLTIIANDTAMPGRGIGKLIAAGAVSNVIASHIGLNPETQAKMISGEIKVELVPQGTLIERIRAGGMGLGGILTATGIGTLVEKGKRIIEVDGKPYLLETPIRGDFALIGAKQADYYGNLEYSLTAHNFNPIIALAGDVVIAEPQHIVPVGVISPELGQDAGRARHPPSGEGPLMDAKEVIARRVAQEVKPEMLVNLGIGLPSLVANFLPKDVHVFFQAENGVIGLGPRPPEGMEDPDLTDAGGGFVTAMPGAASIDSAMSFGIIRGGHLDMTVLGGLEVDERGYLANWMVPGQMVPGMGGAMDLVSGARRVIVAMVHTAKGGHKIVERCSLPLTATRRVSLIVTELAVIEPTERGLVLRERGPGVSTEDIISNTSARLILEGEPPEMTLN